MGSYYRQLSIYNCRNPIEKVIYGVLPPINSNNLLKIFFHGFSRLFKKIRKAKGIGNKLSYFIQPPEWKPRSKQNKDTTAEH